MKKEFFFVREYYYFIGKRIYTFTVATAKTLFSPKVSPRSIWWIFTLKFIIM